MAGNSERSGSGGQTDGRVRLATGVGVCAAAAVGLLLRRDLGSFWLGLLTFAAVLAAGGLLGRLAGSLLFRRPPGGPRT